jgi:hypothetical protein
MQDSLIQPTNALLHSLVEWVNINTKMHGEHKVKLKYKSLCIQMWERKCMNIFPFHGATAPTGPGAPHYRGFAIILRHTTIGRTPVDK